MIHTAASTLAYRLGRQAGAVCRHYLPNGRRHGNYWIVGDVRNTKGRSTYIRLFDTPTGKAGKWTDAATEEHGDLLDIIRLSCGLASLRDTLTEAHRFLDLPEDERAQTSAPCPASTDTNNAARRLAAISRPLRGTLAETYLHNRGITDLNGITSLRFHPQCYYRPDTSGPIQQWPALIALVTDLQGHITGVHRTWLDPEGFNTATLGKAPLDPSRKALGRLSGHAVRFGTVYDVLAIGEGIETVLSVRQILPALPMAAALSATHLAALQFPTGLRRLYIICDNDDAGERARDRLLHCASANGIEALTLIPQRADYNDDLRHLDHDSLRANLYGQLTPEDARRFMPE
ncbi:DUF7146 domain-containing protein [Asticcacaulis tiandongensis]|uniref:DUF7146 domain-containing protein n=1 Tax=Asticcacaulis tiandongensis TaxID=2565365 RepID=UPI0015E86769|nr:toprim domain-containing protein [Asticcacaulis tiandongensis]